MQPKTASYSQRWSASGKRVKSTTRSGSASTNRLRIRQWKGKNQVCLWSLMNCLWCKITYYNKSPGMHVPILLEKVNRVDAEVIRIPRLILAIRMIGKRWRIHGRTTTTVFKHMPLITCLNPLIFPYMITYYHLLMRSLVLKWWTVWSNIGTLIKLNGISIEASRSMLMVRLYRIPPQEGSHLSWFRAWTSTRNSPSSRKPEWESTACHVLSLVLWQLTCQAAVLPQTTKLMRMNVTISNRIPCSSNHKWRPLWDRRCS